MKKAWKRRMLSSIIVLMVAGTGPAAVFADEQDGGTATEQHISEAEESSEASEEVPVPAEKGISEEEIDAYFDGTVFVGDSVMLGFRNYSMSRSNTFLGRIQFLASGSFSVHNAFWPVTSKSVHPIYQGQQRLVWDSIGIMQPRRVFLFFGLNDMNMGSLEETCSLYAQVIANIKTTCPDAEIHIMSMTYTLAGKGKGRLNNPNIRQFNEMLKQMCWDNGWGFVDIANPLADGNGDLMPAYCSDNYVHQTTAAYNVWVDVLRGYARSQIDGSSMFPVSGAGQVLDLNSNSGTISVPPAASEETSENGETIENNSEN